MSNSYVPNQSKYYKVTHRVLGDWVLVNDDTELFYKDVEPTLRPISLAVAFTLREALQHKSRLELTCEHDHLGNFNDSLTIKNYWMM